MAVAMTISSVSSLVAMPASLSWSHCSLTQHRHVDRGGRNDLFGSVGGLLLGSRTVICSSPLVSLSPGRNGGDCFCTRFPPAQRPASLGVRCSSLQGGSVAEDPPVESRQGPRLQWILVGAGLAAAAAAGLVLLRLNGGTLPLFGAPGQALALQGDPGSLAPAISSKGAARFNVKVPGLGNLSLGEVTPGWVYFLLLMAAGFGLFVSEEALNVWDFWTSLSANAPHIISTILWVYCGVCISDMVPFFAGKLASGTGDQLSRKLGVSKEKYEQVTGNIQQFGNLIGFVERFSLGVRNPTSFLAGVAGISPIKFFAGVCVGALFTLPLQMSVGFLLRERPVAGLAGVAAVVGTWTVFPYAAAGVVSLYYFLVQKLKPSQ